ncbi:MAG: hypothetical protein QXT64_04455 [Desulfurococcaceae archaeon]
MPVLLELAAVPRGAGRYYKVSFGSVAGPTSYAAGGFAYDTGLKTVEAAVVVASGGYKAEYVAGKIKVYRYDYPADAAGPAVEVSAGTDLSGVTFTVIAFGS